MSRYFDFQSDVDNRMLTEAFNSTPYEITFGKKGAGDIFFTFLDEDEKEFRIQFYTPAGLGKKVRQVFIGQKKGGAYPDVIQSFKDPMRVIATMVEATKQFLQTPIGKGIDGFAINFSKKALVRGTQLLPKIIKQSDLRSKLEVLDLSYTPVEGRAFVWCLRKGKKAKDVFDGPKMEGVTWDKGTEANISAVKPSFTPKMTPNPKDVDTSILPDGDLSAADFSKLGYRARILGIVDTYLPLDVSTYIKGERVKSVGSGVYKTSSGIEVSISFNGTRNGRTSVEVFRNGMTFMKDSFSGNIRTAANSIKGMVFQAIDKDEFWDSFLVKLKNNKEINGIQVKSLPEMAHGIINKDNMQVEVAFYNRRDEIDIRFDAYIMPSKRQINLPISVRQETFDKNKSLNLFDAFFTDSLNRMVEVAYRDDAFKMVRIDHRELGKRGYYDIDGVGSPRKGETIDFYDRAGDKVNGKITSIDYNTNMMTIQTRRDGLVSLKFISASKNDVWKREVVPMPKDAAEEYMDQIQSEIRGLEKTLGVKSKSSGRLGWMLPIDGQEYYVDFDGLGTKSVTISTDVGGVSKSKTFDDILGTGRLYQSVKSFVEEYQKPHIDGLSILPKFKEVLHFIKDQINIDLSPLVKQEMKRNFITFDSHQLNSLQNNAIARLSNESGRFKLHPNGGFGTAISVG